MGYNAPIMAFDSRRICVMMDVSAGNPACLMLQIYEDSVYLQITDYGLAMIYIPRSLQMASYACDIALNFSSAAFWTSSPNVATLSG